MALADCATTSSDNEVDQLGINYPQRLLTILAYLEMLPRVASAQFPAQEPQHRLPCGVGHMRCQRFAACCIHCVVPLRLERSIHTRTGVRKRGSRRSCGACG